MGQVDVQLALNIYPNDGDDTLLRRTSESTERGCKSPRYVNKSSVKAVFMMKRKNEGSLNGPELSGIMRHIDEPTA